MPWRPACSDENRSGKDVVSELTYPIPWDVVFSLSPHIWHGTQMSVDKFTSGIASRIQPQPLIEGTANLPPNPRFVLVANHYQRRGLWIAHPASIITQAIRSHYGLDDPPMRWVVTANWPPLNIGPWRIASPGDWLLPRVAKALSCYPIAFAGTNPRSTARLLRRLLRDAVTIDRPIGLFPEGTAGVAGRWSPALPGVGRLLRQLAKLGLPVQPAAISEQDRLVIRFAPPISAQEILSSSDPAQFALDRVRSAAVR